ncbi:MAG: Do family serine endopeptidase [Planctomycetes bacterium]|nr:Do family serine endopeptidase [Planctomycetota bacterium]
MMKNHVAEGHVTRNGVISLFVIGLLGVPSIGSAHDRVQAAKELSKAFSTVAKEAIPAVVSIKVEKMVTGPSMRYGDGDGSGFNDPFGPFPEEFLRRFFGERPPRQQQQQRAPRRFRREAQGSGFIISEDGYILTNNHVVGDVDKIIVELQDGRTFNDAKLIGTDPDSEVALIKIEGNGFPSLPLGDSGQSEIGDWVIAIGNPFRLNATVTVGVVSAVGRSNVRVAAYEDFIQTDAAINPGNSGGPLINLDGQVIGINTAIYSGSGGYMGIGFAIPINMARSIADQLKKQGRVSRGYLGLLAEDVDTDKAELLGLKEAAGVAISMIEKGSPAERAGLKVYDVILAIDGRKIRLYDAFRNEVALLAPGTKVRLDLVRDGKPMELTVRLGERPGAAAQKEQAAEEPEVALGLEVQDLTKELADRFRYGLGEGVIVSAVTPDGPAAEKGIRAGDLILSVNKQKVTSVDEFTAAVNQARNTKKVLMLVRRGEVSQFVTLTFE